jgi:hypothetical protein
MRLKVSEIKTGADPKQWAIFERQKLIHDHIEKNGMKNPIVVNSKNELQFGGCRLQYAALSGWEYIDVIVCDDQDEIKRLQNEHSSYEYDFLPEQFIERKQST